MPLPMITSLAKPSHDILTKLHSTYSSCRLQDRLVKSVFISYIISCSISRCFSLQGLRVHSRTFHYIKLTLRVYEVCDEWSKEYVLYHTLIYSPGFI